MINRRIKCQGQQVFPLINENGSELRAGEKTRYYWEITLTSFSSSCSLHRLPHSLTHRFFHIHTSAENPFILWCYILFFLSTHLQRRPKTIGFFVPWSSLCISAVCKGRKYPVLLWENTVTVMNICWTKEQSVSVLIYNTPHIVQQTGMQRTTTSHNSPIIVTYRTYTQTTFNSTVQSVKY